MFTLNLLYFFRKLFWRLASENGPVTTTVANKSIFAGWRFHSCLCWKKNHFFFKTSDSVLAAARKYLWFTTNSAICSYYGLNRQQANEISQRWHRTLFFIIWWFLMRLDFPKPFFTFNLTATSHLKLPPYTARKQEDWRWLNQK